MAYWNANGVSNKIGELREFVKRHDPDIVCLQETKLNDNNRISIPNYNGLRDNRIVAPAATFTKHGTAIYIKRCIPYHRVPTPHMTFVEATIIKIRPAASSELLVASVYVKNDPTTALTAELDLISALSPSIVMCGDFNAKHTSWNPTSNLAGNLLHNFAINNDFEIAYPDNPTRFSNYSFSTIDLTLIKDFPYQYTISSLAELSSDHNPQLIEFFVDFNVPKDSMYFSTNWETFQSTLDNVPNLFENINTPDEFENAVDTFTNTILSAHQNSSTKKLVADTNYTPIVLKDLIKQKNRIRKAWQRYRDPTDRQELNRLQALIKRKNRSIIQKNWEEYLLSLNTGDGSVYRALRYAKRDQTEIPPLKLPNNSTADSDPDKAECIADAYQDQFTENPVKDRRFRSHVIKTVNNRLNYPMLYDPPNPVEEWEVTLYIKSTKIKKSPGPDGVTNKMLKNLPPNIIAYLVLAINLMFKLAIFPKSWKTAAVIPILKPGKDRAEPTSYRPISLLPVLAKVAEFCIRNRLRDFLELNNKLIPQQFGFVRNLSTTHQLLRVTEHIAEGFSTKKTTVALFLDVAKAFDRVWIQGVIYKLIVLKTPHYLIKLIFSYLTERSFKVRVKFSFSSLRPILAGTAQGSVLGPTLFNIYVNDIPQYHKTLLAMFADDTAILAQDNNPRYATKYVQNHIKLLESWLDRWQIAINVDKSAAVVFNRRTAPPPTELTLFGSPLPWERKTKYLGVILDSRLTWAPHYQYIKDKFRKATFALKYLMTRRSPINMENKLLLYKIALRPIITYAAPIWGGAAKSRLQAFDILQNNILRKYVTRARWYMRNEDIRSLLDIPKLTEFIGKLSINFYNSVDNHDNPSILEIPTYDQNDINYLHRPRASLNLAPT